MGEGSGGRLSNLSMSNQISAHIIFFSVVKILIYFKSEDNVR